MRSVLRSTAAIGALSLIVFVSTSFGATPTPHVLALVRAQGRVVLHASIAGPRHRVSLYRLAGVGTATATDSEVCTDLAQPPASTSQTKYHAAFTVKPGGSHLVAVNIGTRYLRCTLTVSLVGHGKLAAELRGY
jgi:hypothetical protein